jgi:hypothetical protein
MLVFFIYEKQNSDTSYFLQAVTSLLNNESVSDIDRLRLVMLYALQYEKESPVQLMQLFNKLASRSPKYKSGVCKFEKSLTSIIYLFICSMAHDALAVFLLTAF